MNELNSLISWQITNYAINRKNNLVFDQIAKLINLKTLVMIHTKLLLQVIT